MFEIADRFMEAACCDLVPEITSSEIGFIGFGLHVPRRAAFRKKSPSERLPDLSGNLILQGKDVSQRALKGLGPQVTVRSDVNELGGNP